MRRIIWAVIATALLLGGDSTTVRADVWDLDTLDDEDDGPGTDNELTHGLVQVHDLEAESSTIDQDWYRVGTLPFSSYEVLVDGLTGDLFNDTLPVDRIARDGITVLGSGVGIPGGIGATLSLRWMNTTGGEESEFVRVTGHGSSCTSACRASDQYTVRFYETSTSVARYNNSGGQVTVLLIQNPASYTIAGRIFYWNAAGGAVGSQSFSAEPRQLLTIATAGVTGATSGSITITQDGRYGDLQGKSVALEPSTGFSFDTAMVYRPH